MHMVGKDERRKTGMPKGLEWPKIDTRVCIFSAHAQANTTLWTGLYPTAKITSHPQCCTSLIEIRSFLWQQEQQSFSFLPLTHTANQNLWIPHQMSCWDCNSNIYNVLKIQWQEQRICAQLPFHSVLRLLSLSRMAYKIKCQQYVDDRATCILI